MTDGQPVLLFGILAQDRNNHHSGMVLLWWYGMVVPLSLTSTIPQLYHHSQ